jgi:alkylation response protein AidB-like acyl-CoA dehydrogenase
VRFLPTDDQRAISTAMREALTKECPPEALRPSADGDVRVRLWKELAELGVFGLTIAEGQGGLDLSVIDAALAFEEIGWAAVPGPLAETLAVTEVLKRIEDDSFAGQWLPAIAAGSAVVTLGLESSALVESADLAELLVLERDGSLYAVPRDATRLTPQPSIDPNRHLFTVDLDLDAGRPLTGTGEPLPTIAREHLLLATSAQLLGLARRALDLAVQHVKIREQFGRPLGMFQAVQHRLADVAVGIEFAESVIGRAACSLANHEASAVRDVAMAKVFASEAAERAAYSGLQVHGAIGYTQEHDFHLYALRAWVLSTAHGDARRHRTRVADELLGPSPAPRFPAA